MKEMMQSGVSRRNQFRGPGEDMGAAIAEAGDTVAEAVKKRKKRKTVTEEQESFNESVGDTSMNLTRRKNRGSGMGTTRSKRRTYGPGSI